MKDKCSICGKEQEILPGVYGPKKYAWTCQHTTEEYKKALQNLRERLENSYKKRLPNE